MESTMSARAANAYKRVDLESAPKSQILDRLFERFQRDLDDARRAITGKDIKTKAAALDHALQIVAELRAALDHAAAPELCANLAALYEFVMERITRASLSMQVAPLDEAGGVMAEIGAAFRQVPR
jgi:flagellar protein FliS